MGERETTFELMADNKNIAFIEILKQQGKTRFVNFAPIMGFIKELKSIWNEEKPVCSSESYVSASVSHGCPIY